MRHYPWVVLLAATACHAGTFIGLVPYTALESFPNGSIVANDARTLTFSVDQGDPTMAYLVGTSRWSVTTCSPPTVSYTVVAEAVAPRDVWIYNMRTCTSEGADDFLENSTLPGNVDGETGSRRRLMSADNRASGVPKGGMKLYRRFLQDEYGLSQQQKDDYLARIEKHPRMKRWAYTQMPESAWKDTITSARRLLGIDSDKLCYGGGFAAVVVYCPNMNTMSEADITQIATLQASIAAENATKVWSAQVDKLFTEQGQINTLVSSLQYQYGNLTASFLAFENTTNAKLSLLENALVQLSTATTASIQTLYANLSTGLSAAGDYADQRVAVLQVKMINNFQVLLNLVAQLTSQEANDTLTSNSRFLDLTRILIDMQLTLYHSIAGTNRGVDRADKQLVFAALAQIAAAGRLPFIRPAQAAVPPVSADAQSNAQLTTYIDITQANYMTTMTVGLSTVRMAHQHTISLFCNIQELSNNLPNQITLETTLSIVGPAGCVANATRYGVNPVRQCQCWWQVSHKSCQAASTFSWFGITTLDDRTAYDLTPSKCQGSVQPTPDTFDGTMFDDLGPFLDYVGSLACDSHPELAGINQFQLAFRRAGVALVNTSYDPDVCTVNYFNLFVRSDLNLTLPYALFYDWVQWYPTIATERGYSEVLTEGVRPGGITSVFVPLVTADNGQTVQCYDSSLDATGTDTNIIYRITALPIEPLCTTNVYSQQPDCTTVPGTCITQGDLLESTTSTATISVDISKDKAPFLDGTILIGELVPLSAGGMTYVVDAADQSKCLSADPRTCEGTNGYLRFNIPDGYVVATDPDNPPMTDFEGLTTWEGEHPGDIYDHTAPTSAGYFERPVDQDRCTVIAGMDFNAVCTVLSSWTIHPNTNMRAGGLVLIPDTWRYQVTLNIVAFGDISTYVVEGCPTTSFTGDDLQGTYLQLTNPSASQIKVSVSRMSVDPNCATLGNLGNYDLGIAPYQGPVTIPTPSTCGIFIMQVFSVASDGTLNPCGPPINTSVSVATQNTILNSELIANATKVTIDNSVTQSVAAGILQAMNFVLQIAYVAAQRTVLNTSITFEQVMTDAFANSSFAAFVASLQAQAAGVNLNNPAFVAQFDALNAISQQQYAQGVSLAANISVLTDQLGAAVAEQNTQIAVLNADTTALISAINAQQAAQQAEITFLQGELAAKACDGFFNGISCFFKNLLSVLVQIAIIAVVIWAAYELYQLYKRNQIKNDGLRRQAGVSGRPWPQQQSGAGFTTTTTGQYGVVGARSDINI